MTRHAEAEQVLRAAGHRLTPQRIMIWDVLRREHGRHLSAEAICAEVQRTIPSFNLASVYRTLALLAELGLVRESRLADGPAVWEVTHEDNHHHLVCRVCGSISHHEDPVMDRVAGHLLDAHGFAAEQVELVVTGICADCRAAGRG
jgi:Fur family ferric uptake transcriptional regulator